ncbi:hypothetical protein V6N13_042693 [Hibiscus sabdariffa]
MDDLVGVSDGAQMEGCEVSEGFGGDVWWMGEDCHEGSRGEVMKVVAVSVLWPVKVECTTGTTAGGCRRQAETRNDGCMCSHQGAGVADLRVLVCCFTGLLPVGEFVEHGAGSRQVHGVVQKWAVNWAPWAPKSGAFSVGPVKSNGSI